MARPVEINFRRLIAGMQQINKEKAEVGLILQFLRPHFSALAFGITERARESLVFDTILATDDAGNSLVLDASRASRFRLSFRNTGNRQTIMMEDAKLMVDSLPASEVGACHALLGNLIEEIYEHSPLAVVLGEMEMFCAAADRAGK